MMELNITRGVSKVFNLNYPGTLQKLRKWVVKQKMCRHVLVQKYYQLVYFLLEDLLT